MNSLLLLLYFGLTLSTGLLSLYLAWYSWQRMEVAGARLLALCLISIAEIAFTFVGLSLATIPETAYFWARLRFLGLAFASLFYFYFVVDYTSWQVPKFLLYGLGIPVIITQVVVWTALDRYFFVNWQLIDLGIIRIDRNTFTGWFNVHNLLSNVVLIAAILRIIYYAWQIDSKKRSAALLLVSGTMVAIIFSSPLVNQPNALFPKITPLGLGIMGIGMALALFRYEFLQLNPIAYDLVVQNIGSGIFVLTRSKTIIQVNPAGEVFFKMNKSALLEKSLEDILETRFGYRQALHGEDELWVIEDSQTEPAATYEFRLSRLMHGVTWLGYLLKVRDISIYKQAETQAFALKLEQERVHLLADFISNTSHDLRNPLAIINSSLYVLKKSGDPERTAKAIQRIEEQSNRIDGILKQFHLFVSLENAASLPLSLIAVNELLDAVVRDYRPLSEKSLLTFHYVPQDAIEIEGDAPLLQEAITALVDNAVVYTHEGGEIWLSTHVDGQNLTIEVRDTGIGIAKESIYSAKG